VTGVAGVLLYQVEQDPVQRGRLLARPALAGRADVGQVVRHDDLRAYRGLRVQVGQQRRQRLGRAYVPALVLVVRPWVIDGTASETPLEPAAFHMAQVLDQIKRSPAGREPARSQFGGRQGAQLVGHAGPEEGQVTQEHLGL